MAYIELTDEELIDMIISRPHLVVAAFEKLQKTLETEQKTCSLAINMANKSKARLKELENTVDIKK